MNLDTDLWPLESENFDLEMIDASDTFAKLETNVYHTFEQEQATLKSTNYEDNASNEMITWDDLEKAVLTPNHEENALGFSPDAENGGWKITNQELVFQIGAVFSWLCLSSLLFLVKCMPFMIKELGKRQSKERKKQTEGETFTQEEQHGDMKSGEDGTC